MPSIIHRNKKKIIVMLFFFLLLNLIFANLLSVGYAEELENDSDDTEKPNILIRILTSGFRFVNRTIYNILDNEGLSIDSLVFRSTPDKGNGEFIGLTIFKPGKAQDFIATFYNVFLYIAIAMFVPIFYWIGIYFSKAGDSPQEKSLLKDRLIRVFITFVFIYSMPELLTVLVKFSNVLVDVFANIGGNFLETENTTQIIGEYIKGNRGSIIETVTGLMLIGINIWIIIFYIIRDLTVAFLAMLFPIIAIWYPIDKNMVTNWWREMAGNILAQPIQAMILSMVLALGSTLGMGGSKSLGAGIYTLVAFGSIIPMTSIVKGFFGLETGIGAGRSMAGIGAMFGAMRLVGMAKRGMQEQTGKIKDGITTLADNKVKGTEMDKNIETKTDNSDVSVSLSNSNTSTIDNATNSAKAKEKTQESMKRQNRAARRQIARGVGGAALGVFTGVTGAAMGAGVGMRGAVVAGGIGFSLGKTIGDKGTGIAYSGASAIKGHRDMEDEINSIQEDIMTEDVSNVRDMQIEELQNSEGFNDLSPEEQAEKIQNLRNKKEISKDEIKNMKKNSPQTYNSYRARAENRYLGLESEKLDGTDFQKQERTARMRQKKWEAAGTGFFASYMANKSYAELTPARKSPEELKTTNNAYIYQDQDHSVVYTKDIEGNVDEILHLGAGNPDLETSIDNQPVAYTTEEIEIPQSEMHKINTVAQSEAKSYMQDAYPHYKEGSHEYRQAYNERERYNKELYTNQFKNNIKQTRNSLGVTNLNLKNDEEYLKNENIRAQEEELQRIREEVKKKTYQEDTSYGDDYNPSLDSLQ